MLKPSLVLLLVACSHPPPPGQLVAGQIHKFKIGSLDAVALLDGSLDMPNDGKGFGLGHSPDETGGLLATAGLPRDKLSFSIQPLLVIDGAHVLLFDTGLAESKLAHAGLLPKSLALAGVEPKAVTDIFISHGHGDHVLGLLTPGGSLAFKNAAIHISAPEWAEMQAKADEKKLVAAIGSKVVPFEPGAQLLPEVLAIATPGHTKGHSSYEISSNGEKLFYVGDVAHHSLLSLGQPSWLIEFDEDQQAGAAMRQQTLAKLAADDERIYAVHFPFPGLGHVRAHDAAFTFEREP